MHNKKDKHRTFYSAFKVNNEIIRLRLTMILFISLQMVCWPIHCQNYKVLFRGVCTSEFILSSNVACSSFFLKLTPKGDRKYDLGSDVFEINVGKFKIRNSFKTNTWSEGIDQQFLDFFKVDSDGNIEYIIIYVEIAFANSDVKFEYLDFILRLHHLDLQYRTGTIRFNVVVNIYKMILTNHNATVFVHDTAGTTRDELSTVQFINFYHNYCHDSDIIPLNKLYNCPYTSVDINQFTVNVDDEFLVFYVDNIPVRSFSRWEYNLNSKFAFLCIEDFLIIQAALLRSRESKSSGETSGKSKTQGKIFALLLTICIWIVYNRRYRYVEN